MERFGESFLLDNCTQARSNLQVSARAPRLPGGENLDQAVLGDFEYCCKLFEHRLLDILKAIQYRTDVVFGDAALRVQDGEHKELCGNNVARGLGFHCTAADRA